MSVQVRVKVADLAEVAKLEQFIGIGMYSVASSETRGLQISVVVPYDTPKGLRTLFRAMRQFYRIAKRTVL